MKRIDLNAWNAIIINERYNLHHVVKQFIKVLINDIIISRSGRIGGNSYSKVYLTFHNDKNALDDIGFIMQLSRVQY